MRVTCARFTCWLWSMFVVLFAWIGVAIGLMIWSSGQQKPGAFLNASYVGYVRYIGLSLLITTCCIPLPLFLWLRLNGSRRICCCMHDDKEAV